jgi:hypothetical protein
MRAALLLVLVALPAGARAQFLPVGAVGGVSVSLPEHQEPPEQSGANPAVRNTLIYNSTKACLQHSDGTAWRCVATDASVGSAISAANTAQDAAMAATYMTSAAATASMQAMDGRVTVASNAVAAVSTRVTAMETTAATQAQLQSAVSGLNGQVTALQSQVGVKRSCVTFTAPSGLSIPLAGISTVSSVPLAGVPKGSSCTAGSSTRMPLGARPDPVVLTAGTISMAFVSNGGLLSAAIAIPSGDYRICCDM